MFSPYHCECCDLELVKANSHTQKKIKNKNKNHIGQQYLRWFDQLEAYFHKQCQPNSTINDID